MEAAHQLWVIDDFLQMTLKILVLQGHGREELERCMGSLLWT